MTVSALLLAEEVVDELNSMVCLPAVALRVSELAADPDTTAAALEAVIRQDMALTTRLLRLANSPALGLAARVQTISRAVAVLGIRTVRDMTLGVAAIHSFDRIPPDLMTMEDFWTHNMLCGVAARELAVLGSRTGTADSAFVGGLIHDIGQLLLFKARPEQSRRALLMLADDSGDRTLLQCERAVLGFTHCEVGGALARRWNLPEALRECIEFYEDPLQASAHRYDAALVHIADRMATLVEIESSELEDAGPIDPRIWALAQVEPACVPAVIEAARGQLAEIRGLLQ